MNINLVSQFTNQGNRLNPGRNHYISTVKSVSFESGYMDDTGRPDRYNPRNERRTVDYLRFFVEDTIDGIEAGANAIKSACKKVSSAFSQRYDKELFDAAEKKHVKKSNKTSPAASAQKSKYPQQNFTIDYAKIIPVLKAVENGESTVDAKWVKDNESVLKILSGFKEDADNGDEYYIIAAMDINRDPKSYIDLVENKYRKEKSDYIKSIWDEYIDLDDYPTPENRAKHIFGLKQLNKYGTRDDMKKLREMPKSLEFYYACSEDSEIVREYAKFVGRVGRHTDEDALTNVLCNSIPLKICQGMPIKEAKERRTILGYDNREMPLHEDIKTYEEMMKAVRLSLERSPKGALIHYAREPYYRFKEYAKLDNPIISENAQAIVKRIKADNPDWPR